MASIPYWFLVAYVVCVLVCSTAMILAVLRERWTPLYYLIAVVAGFMAASYIAYFSMSVAEIFFFVMLLFSVWAPVEYIVNRARRRTRRY